ncbi:GTP-binding protein [Sulfodiicoccus acidiphilus]|uniref:GTP-binding protein n=1 Tax=Sulfodiicoccus acidiphilus TaxID=1670455 RepID=A0A348B746_9CREN|nr:GTPase [Sulfodiicoccus acidiphilus]BBD73998.1 GTP-binding protein [Sulfodiicoccus acidiphilus]GGT87274.1 GTP-binding protein [Sulfodiicoccus acidiphilus]
MKLLLRLLSKADLAVEVVDVREPLLTHSRFIEARVRQSERKILIALNKADLVPREVAESWKKHFEREGLSAVYLAATGHMGTKFLRAEVQRLLGGKGEVVLVGFPKTGKSSVINALKGRHSTSTSKFPKSPGFTKRVNRFRVGNLTFYDTPGTLPPDGDPFEKTIRGLPVEKIPDPVLPAIRILRTAILLSEKELVRKYGPFRGPEELLELIARKRGWVYSEDGEPNVEEAARAVIRQYHEGKITYYTFPPT